MEIIQELCENTLLYIGYLNPQNNQPTNRALDRSAMLVRYQDKKEEIWPSPMTKAPTPTEMSKGQVTTQTTPQKSSIEQRLWTDLGRSVGVTKATQLVCLTGLRAHLPTNRNKWSIYSLISFWFMNTDGYATIPVWNWLWFDTQCKVL